MTDSFCCICTYVRPGERCLQQPAQEFWSFFFSACVCDAGNFWVTTMRVCYQVSCDPVLTKLLVKLSVCWPRRACGEWSKQFRRARGRGWGQGLRAYPSLISLLSDLYLINTPPSEKYSNTFSEQNAPGWGQVESTSRKIIDPSESMN